MWSFAAVNYLLRKCLGRSAGELHSLAAKSWEIAPGETATAKPAFFLPNQLERVTGWAFAQEHPRREMEGGFAVQHAPTRGFLLEKAWLIDGTLYKNNARSFLQPRSSRWPKIRVSVEIDRGAVFCTPAGNKYFGQWLMDDCPTYPLASAEGVPVTTDQAVGPHVSGYEKRLGMKPTRFKSVFFRELVIFEDVGQNRDKHQRFRAMSDRLTAGLDLKPHPGVFIVRGGTGERRLLLNELELAEHLRAKRGFRILDPAKADLPSILATCAGARTIVGVEGSGLIHGILCLPPGGAVLTLQPPNRFVIVYKHLADRDRQHFGFVVGLPEGGDFRIDPTEVERTLDLFPQQATDLV